MILNHPPLSAQDWSLDCECKLVYIHSDIIDLKYLNYKVRDKWLKTLFVLLDSFYIEEIDFHTFYTKGANPIVLSCVSQMYKDDTFVHILPMLLMFECM